MTTLDQFKFYKLFAYEAFNYLKIKINRFINPILEVDYADMVNYTYANTNTPAITAKTISLFFFFSIAFFFYFSRSISAPKNFNFSSSLSYPLSI